MHDLPHLFVNNRQWSARIKAHDPEFFAKLAKQQSPRYLWIGCADSRVPANEIVGLLPGEIFVHRNIANLVLPTDLNCLAVLHYAIEVLRIEHIIVCGHYGCGGIAAAMRDPGYGLIDYWLEPIRDLYRRHRDRIAALSEAQARQDLLCELNVCKQLANLGATQVVQQAWSRGQNLILHGWIYSLGNGLLRDLKISAKNAEELPQ